MSSRKIILKIILPALCFCFLLFSASTSHAACDCPPMEDTDTAFQNSDLVLIGRVVDLRSSVFKSGYMEITFRIRKLLKTNSNIPGSEVVIYVPSDECKFDFMYDSDYIVYAKGDLFFFSTDVCARNMPFDTAFDELERLKKFDKKNSTNHSRKPKIPESILSAQ